MHLVRVIAGPTASGKSGLALAMARAENGVVVNADSMQVYDALPILTAQPAAADRAAAPHRLYGVLRPDEACSAERWRGMAMAEIAAILEGGRTPIVTGGTGLYLAALMHGLSPIPDVPAEFRAESAALQAELGNPGFHARFAEEDPAMAARLHPNDTQRLIRAREVWRATGRSLGEWQAAPRAGGPPGWRFEVTLVLPARAALYARCDARFGAMLEHGALDEVAAFMCRADDAWPVSGALGFRALRDHLRGRITLDDAAMRARTETRQYAKRQVTWFRHQLRPGPAIALTVREHGA